MRENRSKTTLKKHNIDLYLTTESIFRQLRKRRFKFRGWSLAKSAIRYTIDELFQQKKEKINIVELGGGVSTFFWHYLKKEYDKLEMNVTTFEHDKDWSDFLVTEIGASVTILNCKLKQLSENERLTLFEKPEGAIANWQLISNFLPEAQYKTTKVRNVFYNIPLEFMVSDTPKIDLLIVDGPHGNGRSVCFPLLQKRIVPGTLILLDDYNHYPFVDDLKKVCNVETLAFENSYSKKWILLRVI